MKVLVTGGAGYLGSCVARVLFNSGHGVRIMDVAALVDGNDRAPVEYVQADVRDPKAMARAVDGVDVIIHAAAALPFKGRQDIVSVTVDGMKNVLQAARQRKVDRLVFISSTAVYGLQERLPILEDAPRRGITDHARAKIQAERLCAQARACGMAVTVLRPAPLIGEGRMGIFKIFYDWIREGRKIPLIGGGKNKLQLLDVQDLCSAIAAALKSPPELANDDFNVGADRFGTLEEDLGDFIKAVHSHSRVVTVPGNMVRFLLKMGERIKASPLYEGIYGIMDKDVYHCVDKLYTQLGWRPTSSNVDALTKAYRWYLEHGATLKQADGRMDNKNVWKEGVLAVVKKMF